MTFAKIRRELYDAKWKNILIAWNEKLQLRETLVGTYLGRQNN